MSIQELRIAFIEGLKNIYGVNENLARNLFERWHIESRCNVSNVIFFISSDLVKNVFIINNEINRAKRYTKEELENIGIHFVEVVDADKRIFKDSKYGFHWQEKYNGMADAFSGLFELVKPLPEDKHLAQYP